MYYVGLDIHKKTISYCVLDSWMKMLPQPWAVAMEATIFTGWVYDHVLPHAKEVKVTHPVMLRAIAAA